MGRWPAAPPKAAVAATDTPSRGCPVPVGVVLTAAVLLAALVAPSGMSSTTAMLTSTGTATAAVTTAAACASGTPYATALGTTTPAPDLWWRFGEAAGATTVADAAGGPDGQVAGTDPAAALRLGDPGLPQCDTTGRLALLGDPGGATGFVVHPAARTEPAQMALAVWLRAAPGTTGGLFGFGDSDSTTSATSDRVLSLDSASRVTFRVETATGPVSVRSSVSDDVADGAPHLVVATVTPAGGGEHDVRLYVDGTSVDSASGLVLSTAFTGYWRTGDPAGTGADAQLDELALWEGGAPTPTDIAALAAADHW